MLSSPSGCLCVTVNAMLKLYKTHLNEYIYGVLLLWVCLLLVLFFVTN